MKSIKKSNQVFNLDLGIKIGATKAEQERYEAVLVAFSNFLFQEKIGKWGGRETLMGKPTKKQGVLPCLRINYWFVIEEGRGKAIKELKRIVKNFRLQKVSNPISDTDAFDDLRTKGISLKQQVAKMKEFTWTYTRNKTINA